MKLLEEQFLLALGRELGGSLLERKEGAGYFIYRFDPRREEGVIIRCVARASTREEKVLSSTGIVVRICPERCGLEIEPHGSMLGLGDTDIRFLEDEKCWTTTQDAFNLIQVEHAKGGDFLFITDEEVSIWQIVYRPSAADLERRKRLVKERQVPTFKVSLDEVLGVFGCEATIRDRCRGLLSSPSPVDCLAGLGELIRSWWLPPEDRFLLSNWKVVTPPVQARKLIEERLRPDVLEFVMASAVTRFETVLAGVHELAKALGSDSSLRLDHPREYFQGIVVLREQLWNVAEALMPRPEGVELLVLLEELDREIVTESLFTQFLVVTPLSSRPSVSSP